MQAALILHPEVLDSAHELDEFVPDNFLYVFKKHVLFQIFKNYSNSLPKKVRFSLFIFPSESPSCIGIIKTIWGFSHMKAYKINQRLLSVSVNPSEHSHSHHGLPQQAKLASWMLRSSRNKTLSSGSCFSTSGHHHSCDLF